MDSERLVVSNNVFQVLHRWWETAQLPVVDDPGFGESLQLPNINGDIRLIHNVANAPGPQSKAENRVEDAAVAPVETKLDESERRRLQIIAIGELLGMARRELRMQPEEELGKWFQTETPPKLYIQERFFEMFEKKVTEILARP